MCSSHDRHNSTPLSYVALIWRLQMLGLAPYLLCNDSVEGTIDELMSTVRKPLRSESGREQGRLWDQFFFD